MCAVWWDVCLICGTGWSRKRDVLPEKRSALLQSVTAVTGQPSIRAGSTWSVFCFEPTGEPGCFCFCQKLHVCGVEAPACLEAALFPGAPQDVNVLSATVSSSSCSAHVAADHLNSGPCADGQMRHHLP